MTDSADLPLSETEMGKLRWRCRRGLLENDLLIERFFQRNTSILTAAQGQALYALLDLSDPELLDLMLGRTGLTDDLNRLEVQQMLQRLRTNDGMLDSIKTFKDAP